MLTNNLDWMWNPNQILLVSVRQGFFSPWCLPQKTFKLHINDVFVTAEDKKKRDKMKIHYLIVSGGERHERDQQVSEHW